MEMGQRDDLTFGVVSYKSSGGYDVSGMVPI